MSGELTERVIVVIVWDTMVAPFAVFLRERCNASQNPLGVVMVVSSLMLWRKNIPSLQVRAVCTESQLDE